MDGEDPRASIDGGAAISGQLTLIGDTAAAASSTPGFSVTPAPRCEALVVTKLRAGLDAGLAANLAEIVQAAGAGRLGRPKYLVLDFAHAPDDAPGAFEPAELAKDIADLVLRAPVVPVAFVRAPLSAADVELALSCSLVIAQASATFDFDVDPLQAFELYALVAQKIGFVRTERLMEQGRKPDAAEMKDLLLVHDVIAEDGGLAPLEGLLERHLRRHNSFHSIYRAQRMVARPADPARLRPAS